MTLNTNIHPNTLVEMTAEVLSAYVANNPVSASDLPELLAIIHEALSSLGMPAPAPERPVPAVSIKNSITDDYLISLEDGQPYKSLKRHLGIRGLSLDQYREKWGLPKNYPMVAPAYAKKRSELARASGLGKRAGPEQAAVHVPTRRGRPKKG